MLEAGSSAGPRPEVRGKFLFLNGKKYFVKGVTYGTFAVNPETGDFPERGRVDIDFAEMASLGINTVRVYIVPPRWLLDLALKHGLHVFVGMPWEQHIAFLAQRETGDDILSRLGDDLKEIAGHPAILAYAIGNEIPASVVRWHGRREVADFLERLADLVRKIDSEALVTYVNFPTTEYLELPFVDFVSFNVYLEDTDRLWAYMARLQSLAGEKPLLMAELGLDSLRNGLDEQARSLTEQLTTVFEAGVAGSFVFAWTDEWHRGGHEIDDWDFGLVTRDRTPKPALEAVVNTYAHLPIPEREWPKVSVVVCSYNGGRTIRETIEQLLKVDYPNYEVIVVNDGSTDDTPKIAEQYDVKTIPTENRGLSNARNTGLEASSGVYVAYIDDDAYPDPHWLKYLVITFEKKGYAAVGGPNIAPPEDSDLAECVANAPGGPTQVLIDDEIADHVPGCNMAFRSEKLREIGGFDPQFRVAGDDVDACWRIMEAGGVIGFAHAAVVWHHRRPSVRTYFKQQMGYARAESLVARIWPEKYNRIGHMTWHGRLYGRGMLQNLTEQQRIYHGTWGSAPFQSVYRQSDGVVTSLPLMPEWYFLTGLFFVIGLLGFDWPPLFFVLILGLGGLAISVVMAFKGASKARFASVSFGPTRASPMKLRAIVFWLYLVQPLGRLIGRIKYRLGPWSAGKLRLSPVPRQIEATAWSENWMSPEALLDKIAKKMKDQGVNYAFGGAYDGWDFTVLPSIFGELRLLLMHEEHGSGQQYFRLRVWPVSFIPTIFFTILFLALSVLAFADAAPVAGVVMLGMTVALAVSIYGALSAAMAAVIDVVLPVMDDVEKQTGEE
ncbi:glycosyltransferase [Tateyamaria pelophila]|uniref:glycosyltransferase n=1 Tax=Tateyamaria pelophila TaxID=328415 RepID=UPI001CC033DD|nr:glycosyltransferase [Tateyamaria pelophila]